MKINVKNMLKNIEILSLSFFLPAILLRKTKCPANQKIKCFVSTEFRKDIQALQRYNVTALQLLFFIFSLFLR